MSFSESARKPSYRRQKRAGGRDLAFVIVDGTRRYLGPYDSPASREMYERILAERAAGIPDDQAGAGLTVTEVLARFWEWAQDYFRRLDGTTSSELDNYRHAARPLRELYGTVPAQQIGPNAVRSVVQHMVRQGGSRNYVNSRLRRLKRIFKWAVSWELIPPSVYHAIATVEGLRFGHTAARETRPVKPVLRSHVEAVLPHVRRQVAAAIELQWLTGARSGEILSLRPSDIDTSGSVWVFTPQSHKNQHRGHERLIYLGPKAQAIVAPFLTGRSPWAYCFSPREAENERREAAHAARCTPLSCGNRPGTNRVREPKREPGERYEATAYARAIARACKIAGVPHWHPHQLRHAAATVFRKRFGIDTASVLLGHKCPSITSLYAEADREKAMEIARNTG